MIGYFVYFFSLSAGQVTTSIKNEEKQTNNKKQKTKDEKQIIHMHMHLVCSWPKCRSAKIK